MSLQRFPNDPRHFVGNIISQDIRQLKDGSMLNMRLLDVLLHVSGKKDTTNLFLASFGTTSQFDAFLANKSQYRRLQVGRKKFVTFRTGRFRLLLPFLKYSHFYLLDVTIDNTKTTDIVEEIKCYDSKKLSSYNTRGSSKSLTLGMRQFLELFIKTWNCYVVYNETRKQLNLKSILEKLQTPECPQQQNGVDCGLFVLVNCIHILDGIEIKQDIYGQKEISNLRNNLAKLLEDLSGGDEYVNNEFRRLLNEDTVRQEFAALLQGHCITTIDRSNEEVKQSNSDNSETEQSTQKESPDNSDSDIVGSEVDFSSSATSIVDSTASTVVLNNKKQSTMKGPPIDLPTNVAMSEVDLTVSISSSSEMDIASSDVDIPNLKDDRDYDDDTSKNPVIVSHAPVPLNVTGNLKVDVEETAEDVPVLGEKKETCQNMTAQILLKSLKKKRVQRTI